MKILAITSLYPNAQEPTRGVDNREQFLALARHHGVRVIAPIAWTAEFSHRSGPSNVRLPDGRRTVDGSVPVTYPRYLFTPKVLRSWYGEFFRRSVQRSFNEAVSRSRPDVVIGSWAYPDGWAAVALAHAAGIPAVVKVHGCDVLNEGLGITNFPGRYQGTIDALTGAESVVAVGRHLADAVEALGVDSRRVHVVSSGIDRRRFHPGDRDEARRRVAVDFSGPVVLFAGRLAPVKGLEHLLSACRIVADVGMAFRCYLVGDGPQRQWLTERVGALDLGDCVRIVGAQGHDRLPDWYRAADLAVLPSVSEGVPNVLLEALACGTPFVATRVGGIPEICAAPDRLVPPGNAPALACAIQQALATGEQNVASNAVISWDESADQLSSVLERAIREYGARTADQLARATC